MKKGFAVFLLVLFFGVPVWAQEKIKIGFIDIQRAISESEAGKKAREEFQAQVKKVEANLLKEKEEVERLKSDFDKKSLLLNDEERRNLERGIQKRERSYRLSMRDYQQELQEKEGKMTADILRDLQKIVNKLGKEENFTLILERSQVPYGDQKIDITDRVIKLYNSRAAGKVPKGK